MRGKVAIVIGLLGVMTAPCSYLSPPASAPAPPPDDRPTEVADASRDVGKREPEQPDATDENDKPDRPTNTPKPPSPTATPIPPTLTNTPIPPTPTIEVETDIDNDQQPDDVRTRGDAPQNINRGSGSGGTGNEIDDCWEAPSGSVFGYNLPRLERVSNGGKTTVTPYGYGRVVQTTDIFVCVSGSLEPVEAYALQPDGKRHGSLLRFKDQNQFGDDLYRFYMPLYGYVDRGHVAHGDRVAGQLQHERRSAPTVRPVYREAAPDQRCGGGGWLST